MRESVIRMTNPNAKEVPIHTICIPEREPMLNISVEP